MRFLVVRQNMRRRFTFHSPGLHKDRRVTLNKKQKNEISDSTAYITETRQTMWSFH